MTLIETLEMRAIKVEKVLNIVKNVAAPECIEQVKTIACEKIEKYISKYKKEIGNISLTAV